MTEDDGGFGIHTLRLDWIWKHDTDVFERNVQHSTVPQTMHTEAAIACVPKHWLTPEGWRHSLVL